jgi:uncharacterized phage protein (TIGR01671 family)
MREIQFRGKKIETNEWIEGYYIVAAGMPFIYVFGVLDPLMVEPTTVGQYTGLKDKKGKKIYEGDIIKISGDYKPGIYTVIWDSYRVAWWLKNVKQREREHDDDYYQLLDNTWQDREIIGNIHDNPELLEARP